MGFVTPVNQDRWQPHRPIRVCVVTIAALSALFVVTTPFVPVPAWEYLLWEYCTRDSSAFFPWDSSSYHAACRSVFCSSVPGVPGQFWLGLLFSRLRTRRRFGPVHWRFAAPSVCVLYLHTYGRFAVDIRMGELFLRVARRSRQVRRLNDPVQTALGSMPCLVTPPRS